MLRISGAGGVGEREEMETLVTAHTRTEELTTDGGA